MNSIIKRNIKLIAERFHQSLSYDRNTILINGEKNVVKIESNKKNEFQIEYTIDEGYEKITASSHDIYDLLISIITRGKHEKVEKKNGFLLTLDNYFQFEGSRAKKDWDQLSSELKGTEIESRCLFGNRFEAFYFKGVVILTDDLGSELSNVVDFNSST